MTGDCPCCGKPIVIVAGSGYVFCDQCKRIVCVLNPSSAVILGC